jgi:hypothetical protein
MTLFGHYRIQYTINKQKYAKIYHTGPGYLLVSHMYTPTADGLIRFFEAAG